MGIKQQLNAAYIPVEPHKVLPFTQPENLLGLG